MQQLEPKIALAVDSNFMEFVPVGDPGNAADWVGGPGAVDYEYRIGKYEVTIGQYTEFLNAVAKSDPYGLWDPWFMDFYAVGAGIQRAGTDGAFVYEAIGPRGVTPPGADSPDLRPITGVSWLDAARFANWMSNGRPEGPQDVTTTEDGAYAINGLPEGQAFEPISRNAVNPNTGSTPTFFLPTRSEWHKAAYYSPVKNGSNAPGYYTYATQSDVKPSNAIGAQPNNANVRGDGEGPNQPYAVTQSAEFFDQDQNYLTNVGAFSGGASYYGTFDQQGNVAELTETFRFSESSDGTFVDVLGYCFTFSATTSGQYQGSQPWQGNTYSTGFRLAGTFDYSDDPDEPTLRGLSTAGSGLTLSLSNTAGGSGDTRDYVTFTVPDGHRLTSFVLDDYESSDTRAFIGIQSGAAITATAADPSALLGHTHFGPGATGAGVGADLIDPLGGPLDAGTYSVWIQQLGASTRYGFTLETTNLNAQPTAVQFVPPTLSLPEDTDTSERIKLADIVVVDDGFGTNVVELLGFASSPEVMNAFEVDDLFEIDESVLYLKAGVALDFDVASSFEVFIYAYDTSLPSDDAPDAAFTLTVSDVNEPPQGVTLSSPKRWIADGTSTADRIRMAEIGIVGDRFGDHAITLSGPDAASFEVEDFVLYLKAGTTLNRVSKPTYAVSVDLRDTSLPGSPAVTTPFKLSVVVNPTRVADINQMPVGSNPRDLTIAENLGYFAVRDPAGPSGSFGVELSLWKTDGTSEGTVRVGPDQLRVGAVWTSMAAIGSTLFFVGSDGTSGFGLWKTDGTESGTVLISPGGLSLTGGYNSNIPFELKAVGSTLFFVARDEDSGQELWKTDGTPEGTVQVSDISPGEDDSRPAYLTATESALYFVANNGTSGRQLWRTDGTDGGTVQLTDVPDDGYGYTGVRALTAVSSTLYFTADDGTSGQELWKTDGTQQGTTLVKDLFAGSSGSNPLSLTAVGSTLFFIANDSPDDYALWKSDGTAEGTIRVTPSGLSLGEVGQSSSDRVFTPNEIVALGDATLFFVADDGTSGKAIWKTDGTEQGSVLVADVVAGENGVSPARLTPVNDELFFFADGNKLWKTNGTSAGTSQVATIGDENPEGSGSYGAMAVLNGSLLFAAYDGEHGNELWVADIATGQASLLSDIDTSNRGSFNSYDSVGESVMIGSMLYFAADDGVSGRALWRTDGTEQGAVRIIAFAENYGGVGNLTAFGASLYFTIDNLSGESSVTELWRTDGTAQSTVRVTRFSGIGSYGVRNLTPAGSLLYFTADTKTGEELWKSNGTEPGTELVKDIRAGASSSDPRILTAVGSTLFFVADDGVSGHELWKTDGTGQGTVLVRDIRGGASGSYPMALTAFGSTLYFTAYDSVSGTELWKTDGTEQGTVRVRDIRAGAYGSSPMALTAFGSSLYFTADDGVVGEELWKTDGTGQGTILVADLATGTYYLGGQGEVPAGSNLHGFTTVGSDLFFANGSSLWKTNGTEAGTVQVSDDSLRVNRLLGAAGTMLFMIADDGASGLELWRYTENDAPTGVTLTPASGSIAENTSTGGRIKVAGITITDDGLGTNSIALSGPDATSFEVVGLELFLKSGVLLDFEAKASYAVTVSVADASVSGSSPVTAGFTLNVTDAPEAAVISLSTPFANAVTEDASVDASSFLVTSGAFRIVDPDAGQAAFKTTVGVPAGVTNLGALTINAGGTFTYRVRNSLDAVQALRAGQTRSDVFTIESLDGTKLDVTFSIAGVVDTLRGVVADGYLAGATVFADTNGNRVLDAGELFTTTDNAGNFSFDFGSLTATLISIGGTDISTGLPFAGSLTAPAGSTVINPLTTVVAAAVEASLGGAAPADAAALATAVAAATSKVVAGLGLPTVNLTTFDPLAPTADQTVALAVQKVAAAVANVMVVANTVGADVRAVVRNVASAVTAAPSGATVNLADTSVLTQVLTAPAASGGSPVAPPAAAIVALTQSNLQISSAGNLGAIADLQTSVQSAGGFVDENAVASTIVYQAKAPAGMTGPAFSLKEVAGDDRSLLSIDASTGAVRLLSPANFEAKGAYRFTVVASQQGQATVETVVSVRVNDLNEAPTGLALTVTSVAENQPAGTVIGTLSASDQDAGDTLTFSLVPGDGSGDNGAFTIDGNQLKAASTFNFEVRNSYSVRIRVSDAKGLVTEVPVTISVVDVADEPLVVERVTAPAPAIFGAGQRVQFAVTLSEIVQVRGKPQIQVRAGGTTRTATYVSGSGSATLTFQYVVGKADVADVVSIGQKFVFAKKSAIVAGAEKLAAALPAGIAGLVADGVRIDAVPSSVIGKVRVPVGGTYRVGDSLDFIVRFSEAVIVSGAPQIGLTGLSGPRQATYVSGTGSTELTFRYVVRSGDAIRGKKGLGLAKSISLPGGASIGDEAGNRAVLKVSAPSLKTIRLDAAASTTEMAAPNKRSRAVAFATLG